MQLYRDTFIIKTMKQKKKFDYELVNWNKPIPFYMSRECIDSKIVKMTQEEAYELNRGLTLNRTGMRYVRTNDDTKR